MSLITTWYAQLSITLAVLLLVMLLDKIGKGIVLRETIAFLYVFTCLVMPIIGYNFYDASNRLAKLWVRYMPVPVETYFVFALPAVSFFCFALTLPFATRNNTEEGQGLRDLINRIKTNLLAHPKTGWMIAGVGLAVSFVVNFLPAGLQFFATLFYFGSFAGLLYTHYSPNFKYKKLSMWLFGLFILNNALVLGMFTIVAYMGFTIFSFFLLGKRISMFKKLFIFIAAAFLLIVLQNVKLTYRNYVWHSNYSGSKMALFSELFFENIQKGGDLVEKNAFFQIYTRANQGYNVALVMRRIPAVKPFDNGNNLLTNFASAFVPRFLWPDKPEAGGKFNMEYYAGWRIHGWSTNVGPLGEAYGSFGVTGGIVYMFFLGLFIRWIYLQVFKITRTIPLLVCWLPVFFFQIISSSETDSLQIFNSLIKASFFVWLLYKVWPQWFGVIKKKYIKRSSKILLPEPSR
ncbi:MAG: hypothetical protein ABIQ88_17650 [Chitinophagaceae bacterium]